MNDEENMYEIFDKDLEDLKNIYKSYFPSTLFVYNLLNSATIWKTKRPRDNQIKILVPFKNWRSNGTFILIHRFYCYEVYMFTLDNNGQSLFEIIVKNKIVDWKERILIYSVNMNHYSTIQRALNGTEFFLAEEIPCTLWWMPKDKAFDLDINYPPSIYIDRLQSTDADIINLNWPHNYHDSEKFIASTIEIGGGYGIFLKSNHKLIAWILRIKIGLGTLQVLDEYKRKGYGSLITRHAAKEMAKEGITPVASTLNNNAASCSMLSKIGFEKCLPVMYLQSKNREA